jgi:hypothetical protein
LSITEANVEELKRRLDPKLRIEKMIYNIVLLSGSVQIDPDALDRLLQSYIGLEVTAA